MATGTTTNLGLSTVEANDQLPEALTKANIETLDSYVAATSMTNKSGSQRVAGEVVVVDTTTNSSYTTTTTAGHAKVAGVVQATTANNAAGIVKHYGTSLVQVTGTTARGDWLTTSTTAGKALPTTASSPPAGAFAIALTAVTGVGTVTAMLISAAGAVAVTTLGLVQIRTFN